MTATNKQEVYMNKRQEKPPTVSLSDRWTKVCILLLLSTIMATSLRAQTDDNILGQIPKDKNSELRTGTWSLYAQGGLSWATDVWYHNLNAQRSYFLSPVLGGGVDYTIRPWVRVGAEYLWSNYRREQNYSSIDASKMPVQTYGNYQMNYHNAKIGAQFNLMEFWPDRQAQWLNIWGGTGFGYSFAKGNEYGAYFSNTLTQNGITTPLVDGNVISNGSEITITGNVKTTNRQEKYNSPFIPVSLHIEADLNRRLTVGLKGEMDWIFRREGVAPENLLFAMVSIRYNLVPSSARVQRSYYEGVVQKLNARERELKKELEAAKASAEREALARQQVEERNENLRQNLADCEHSKERAENVNLTSSHFVQFDHNSSYFSSSERDRLKEFARSVLGKKLSIVAEASTPGTEEYNQQLSQRRLERVVKALIEEGFAEENLYPQSAIGEQNGKPSAEGRRVTITVNLQ